MAEVVTLEEVGRRALKCEEFFRQLLDDYITTLDKAGLALSVSDLMQLQSILARNEATVDLKRLSEMVHSSLSAPLTAGGRTWK